MYSYLGAYFFLGGYYKNYITRYLPIKNCFAEFIFISKSLAPILRTNTRK